MIEIEEMCSLDIFDEYDQIDMYELFPRCSDFVPLTEIYTEAANTPKKSVGKVLSGLTQKIWKAISTMSDTIAKGAKRIFQSLKKQKKSVDQVVMEIFGGAKKAIDKYHYNRKIANGTKAGELDDDILSELAKAATSGDMSKAPRILSLEYNDGHKIRFNVLINGWKGFTSSSVHTKGIEKWAELIGIVFHCVEKPELLDPIIDVLKELESTHNVNLSIDKAEQMVSDFYISQSFGSQITFTLEQWVKLNEKCAELGKLMVVWDDFMVKVTQNDKDMDKRWISVFNQFANISAYIQYGLNIISDSFRQSYDLNPAFHDACKDIETLSKFVEGCVEANVPAKYLYKATKEFSDKSINHTLKNSQGVEDLETKDTKADKMAGHGRFVMFPDNEKEVIKVAYNIYGLRSNKVENEVWEGTKDVPEVHSELCPIIKMSKNEYVMVMTRAGKYGKKMTKFQGYAIGDELNKYLIAANKPFLLIDINDKGFGTVDGKRVILDYGQVRRRNTT